MRMASASLRDRRMQVSSIVLPRPVRPSSDRGHALELLRLALNNPKADFRNGQWEAISALLERRARVLVVQRTGWGKSMIYFLATRLLRKRGAGCTVLISPLLSLMRNQMAAARRIGVRAATINSTNREDWEQVIGRLQRDEVDILLVSPERLANDEFVTRCLLPLSDRVGLFVVDEVHCISDWGHDFRPDYRRIARILKVLPQNVPVLATTATANDRVVRDVSEQLGPKIEIQRGPLARTSLRLQAIRLPSQVERMAWLAQTLPAIAGSGIIYTLTVRDAERLAAWLRSCGIPVEAYHARMDSSRREELEDRLLRNEVKALVATVALGMGFDKPDLSFVIHFQRPASVVHYYQQVGRAGRAVESAYGILLHGEEDDDIADYFIRTAFPEEGEVEQLLAVLRRAARPMTLSDLERELNVPRRKLQKILKFLLVESPAPVQCVRSAYVLNPVHWRMPVDRIRRITDLRRQEQETMKAYLDSRTCLMQFLTAELNDPHSGACGRCAVCAGPLFPARVSGDLVSRALEFLQRQAIPILPRKQWPSGLADPSAEGMIAETLRAMEGRALCRWGDPDLGALVKEGKQVRGRFDDRLVEASAELILRRWRPQPSPSWVTCVPSTAHPGLVPDFARRLAHRLGLEFVECVTKTRKTDPQKSRANSYQQAANVLGAFAVDPRRVRRGPVLLVDDLVDSRWTMTVVAAALRRAGSGPVFPFALADSSTEDE